MRIKCWRSILESKQSVQVQPNKLLHTEKITRCAPNFPVNKALEGSQALSDYQLTTIRQIWVVLPYLLLVSGIYWYWSRSFFKSVHGIAILLAFGYAVWVCELTEYGPPLEYYVPMYALLIAGLGSMLVSL